MKNFVMRKAPKWAAIVGALCLVLAAAILCTGIEDSRKAQIMAEKIGKDYAYAGGGWYPANGTDYDLEARVVGQEGWVSHAINADYGDQIEFRLRIASGEGVDVDNGTPPFVYGVSATSYSNGLAEVTDESGKAASIMNYQSPDVQHVAYAPLGVYTVDHGGWGSYDFGIRKFEVYYFDVDNAPSMLCCEAIYIIPPYNAVNLRAVIGFVWVGLVFILVALIISLIRSQYEEKTYALEEGK